MDKTMDFSQLVSHLPAEGKDKHYPLETWHPNHCGSLDLEIDIKGQWWSTSPSKTPYTRPELISLFAQLIWCEPADYCPSSSRIHPRYSLKSPVELLDIVVVDVPFLIVDCHWKQKGTSQQALVCTTNLGDVVTLSSDHELVLHYDTELPYVRVRRNLWAKLSRNVYYRLIDELLGEKNLKLLSCGQVFSLMADS